MVEHGIEGTAWVFGDAVNTDDMYPGFAIRLPVEEAAQAMFSSSRPGWPSLVQPGDIVVGGRNFGLGSSRPVPALFRQLGVAALVAEQFNSLFYRNCINYGLPALTVPGIRDHVAEGDRLRVDVAGATVSNLTAGTEVAGVVLPPFIQSILRSGGLVAQLEATGALRTPTSTEE